jgi:hypothetical protein
VIVEGMATMWRRRKRAEWGTFQLAGWLFTDLLLAMMMVFLVSAKDGIPNVHSQTGGVTPPEVCGIDPNYHNALVTVSDPIGVRNRSASAMSSFFRDVSSNKTLKADAHRVAGVVEVFGGSSNVNDGITFASGAIASLKAHSNGQFIFSSRTVYFKALWDGTISSNQVRVYVFYYILATSCGSQ